MPSAFAHACVGAAVGCALPRQTPHRKASILLLAAVAAAPDLDVIGLHLGVPYAHPLGHRGFSHSIVFAALCALGSIPLWRQLSPKRPSTGALLTFLALASHGILDCFTNAGLGIGLLIPIDSERYFAPWRPIATSPLSVRAFFSEAGIRILVSEVRWIGPPTAAFLALVVTLRSWRAAHAMAE